MKKVIKEDNLQPKNARGGRGGTVTLGTCSSSALDLSAGKMGSSGLIIPVLVSRVSFLLFPSKGQSSVVPFFVAYA